MNWKIWIWVPAIYGVFSLWYHNWSGPLSAEEIDKFVSALEQTQGQSNTDLGVLKEFLSNDDGGEFVMLNLVELHQDPVAHPLSGAKMSASNLVSEYFEPFAMALFKRGGHPVFQARTVGGNIDSWNADGNVGFGVTAMMRYRSRRDLLELVLDPAFADGHIYKLAAIERTISYPTHIMLSTSLRPPIAVLLILILLASMAQNVALAVKRSS